jgi:hypothetical protein
VNDELQNKRVKNKPINKQLNKAVWENQRRIKQQGAVVYFND